MSLLTIPSYTGYRTRKLYFGPNLAFSVFGLGAEIFQQSMMTLQDQYFNHVRPQRKQNAILILVLPHRKISLCVFSQCTKEAKSCPISVNIGKRLKTIKVLRDDASPESTGNEQTFKFISSYPILIVDHVHCLFSHACKVSTFKGMVFGLISPYWYGKKFFLKFAHYFTMIANLLPLVEGISHTVQILIRNLSL